MVNITLNNTKPFSINKAYYKRSFTRTKDCRTWADDILIKLQDERVQAEFKELRDRNPFALRVEITHYIPEKIFFTKEKKISRRSNDLTNVEKLLVDLVNDERFDGRSIQGQEVNNLNLDDKLYCDLISKKRPHSCYKIEIQISEMTREELYS